MSTLSIQPTYPIFTDNDGQPLEDGYVWIGAANLDPQTNPINVYWDIALTLPAAQPIRTLAGYPSNSGAPARLYVNSDYSIRVMNKTGSVVYSAQAATERYSGIVISTVNSNQVIYEPDGTGAVERTVESRLRDAVSVKDFGAVGDGVTDDTVAIQNADAAAFAAGKSLSFPSGTYKIDGSADYLLFQASWSGESRETSIVEIKNIQWLNQDYVKLSNICIRSDADRTSGNISGFGGTNGFSTKNGTSGCVDIAAVSNVYLQNCKLEHTDGGTANLFKTEGCGFVSVESCGFLSGGCSMYGNKQNRLNAAYGISTANTAANIVYAHVKNCIINGQHENDFDLINWWGGTSGSISGNTIVNSNYDGMDLYTSGERISVTSNILQNISRIGIQTKFGTEATDRDSAGAGRNEYVVISNNVITDVGPLATDPTTSIGSVSDICGIYALWGDSQNEFPTPDDDDMLRYFVISNNIVRNVNDDNNMADADCRVFGIICDAFFANISNNLVTGVRRGGSGTNSISGTALGMGVLNTCPTNQIVVSGNIFSAERIGVYLNGQTRAGVVSDITLSGNRYVKDEVQTSSIISQYGVFISPDLERIKCIGEAFDVIDGQAYHIRASDVDIDCATVNLGGSAACIWLQDTCENLSITNCTLLGNAEAILMNDDATRFSAASSNWKIIGNTCNGGIDLRANNSSTGSMEFLEIKDNSMLLGSRIIVGGYDVASGNQIRNFQITGNTGHDFTDHFIELARMERGQVNMNHGETSSTVNLVRAANSCDYILAALNTATLGGAATVNLGTGVNNVTVSNVAF